MATAVTLHISPPHDLDGGDAGRSWRILLSDDYDTVFGHVFPATSPSSALEARTHTQFTTVDGKPIYIAPGAIHVIEGDVEA